MCMTLRAPCLRRTFSGRGSSKSLHSADCRFVSGSQEYTQVSSPGRFKVNLIEWVYYNHENIPITLAQLRFSVIGKLLSKVMEDYIDKVRLDGTKSAPYLRVLKHFTENKTRVQIVIKFNERRYHAVKTPKQIPWKRGTLKGSPIRTGRNVRSKRQNQGRAPTTAPYTTNVYATTAKTTTNKTTTTTTPSTSTVPTLEYDEEKDTLGPLTDSVMFLPLVPPATYLETTIHTTSHTITDSFLVLCSIPRGYLGLPPINMSIWQIEKDGKRKLLSTKQGTLNLRYNPLYSQITKYSCRVKKSHTWGKKSHYFKHVPV
ncbi:hypothetical protein RRG08_066783 [Elysia crispata]|uniref:Uncharacterized protein n=1 Tax=Elysia crispata TaxID=231223 RepID=A0AAE0XPJ9_9GAST|nr:hypothetical protein RRG08_066783 [Elysia crispata]